MPRLRIAAVALVVALLNLASVVVGFAAWKLSGTDDQLAVQMPVALVAGILLVVLWLRGCRRWHGVSGGPEGLAVLLLAIPLGAAVFTAVHFVLTGTLTAVSNLVALLPLQFGENVIALPLAAALGQRSEASCHPR